MRVLNWAPALLAKTVSASAVVLALAVTMGASGCGSDTKATPSSDTVAADVSGGDGQTTADVAAGSDATPTSDTGADTGTCGALPACLDNNGKTDLSMCPKPATDYDCLAGCCVKKFVCNTDADCADKNGTPLCPDKQFTCGCNADTGQCWQTMCQADAACPSGMQCHQGGCIAPLADNSLNARLLRPSWLGAAGAQFDAVTSLGAQAVDKAGNVKPDAQFEFALAPTDAFTLSGTQLTATSKPGTATVTAKVKGSSAGESNPATLWNLGPIPAGQNLRVTAVDDDTLAPLAGKVVVIGLANATTPTTAQVVNLVGGQASFAGVQFPADIHVIGTSHAPVSVLRYDPGTAAADVVLPAPLFSVANLEFDLDGKLVSANSKLVNVDLLKGAVAYTGTGEAGVGVTSLAFGPSLLNFAVQSILGPQVKRPFDKEAPAVVNPDPGKAQDVPGGVTFMLGKPVVSGYVLAGTPGKHTLWTLAGKVALSDVIPVVSAIVDNVKGGIDIGQIVSLLLPYFSSFRSQVAFDVPFADTLTQPTPTLNLAPVFPLGLHLDISLPALPSLGDKKWADLAFVIAGAMMPKGEIIPLGLTAGADTQGDTDTTPDGQVDGNSEQPGQQPLHLDAAPLHSGTRVGTANHVVVTAAVVLANADKGKKEGASVQITAPGTLGTTVQTPDFLGFPSDSTFNPATATLQVKAVAGAQFYRLTLHDGSDHQWLVVVPATQVDKPLVLPDLTVWGADVNLLTAPNRAYVAAFELAKSLTFPDVVGAQGLIDLVRLVKRSAFYDVLP